jgi:hypothetical protein
MSARTARKSTTSTPSTLTATPAESVDSETLAALAAIVTAETSGAPEKSARESVPEWNTYANPAEALSVFHVGTVRQTVTAERKAEENARTAQYRTSLLAYSLAWQGSTYKEIGEALSFGSQAGIVNNRLILGAMLAQLGSDLTAENARTLGDAARTVAPNRKTFAALMTDAPTGLPFLEHVAAHKVTALEEKKTRKPRPATGEKKEGTDGRTGETQHADALVPATPAEILQAATREIILAAHANDPSLIASVRALTAACVAYADVFADANPMRVEKKTTAPRKPRARITPTAEEIAATA